MISMLLLSWTVFRAVHSRKRGSKTYRKTKRSTHLWILALGYGIPCVMVALSTLFRPAAYALVPGIGPEPVIILGEIYMQLLMRRQLTGNSAWPTYLFYIVPLQGCCVATCWITGLSLAFSRTLCFIGSGFRTARSSEYVRLNGKPSD